jgi:hypothetical protein
MPDTPRRRPSRPLLLAMPTRAATLARPAARWWLALILLVTLALLAMAAPPIEGGAALLRDAGLVERLRHGGGFYPIAADTLRSGGESLRPALAFPLPALPVILAAIPPIVAVAMAILLAAVVAMAWQARLVAVCGGMAGQIMLLVLLLAGLVPAGQPGLTTVPEMWAGLLIALSLVRRRPGRWAEAAGFALAAALTAGVAALYLVVMAACAWAEGYGREAAGWLAALVLLVMVLGFHLHGVAGVLHPLDMAGELAGSAGWTAGFATVAAATAALVLPASIGAALVLLGMIGWAAWRDPLAIRAGATIAVVLAMLATGMPAMGGLLVAPVALVGLVFIADLLRDLVAGALDNRRITVRRSVR